MQRADESQVDERQGLVEVLFDRVGGSRLAAMELAGEGAQQIASPTDCRR